MLLGPHGLNFVDTGEVMGFLATIGLVFLTFTAKSEIKLSALKKAGKNVLLFSTVNLGIPSATGCLIEIYLGLTFLLSLVLGVCFGSSSVGLIVCMSRELNIDQKIKSTLVSSIFLEDVISLILLAILLKAVVPISPIPLEIFPIALLFFVLIVLYVIPIVQEWLLHFGPSKDAFAVA